MQVFTGPGKSGERIKSSTKAAVRSYFVRKPSSLY